MTLHTLTPTTPDPDGAGAGPTNTDHQALTHTPPVTHGTADQTQAMHRRRTVAIVALALILGMADVILIKSTYNAILDELAWMSWVLALVTAIGATALAWSAGSYAAIALVHRNHSHAILASATGAAWALLGAGLFWLRWNAAELGQTEVLVEGQSTAGDAAATQTHHVLAVVLITLYVMPGLLAFAHAFDLANPIAALQRATHARVTTLQTQLPHDEARATELTHLLERHHTELDHVPTNAQTAKNAAHDLATELKAYAAAETARQIGDPTAVPGPTNTNTPTQTDQPDPDHEPTTPDTNTA